MPDTFQTEDAPPDVQKLKIAYLLSGYPAVSHTFFLNEVLGMRERNFVIETASINPPDRPMEELPAIESAEAHNTYYIKSAGMFRLSMRVLGVVFRHPVTVIRGLCAASALGGWDWKSRAFAFFYLAEALLVGEWMRARSLSHLHVHFGGSVATVGMLTAKAWGIPWSLTLHGPDEFFDQEAFYLRQKIESARFVVCISDFCCSQVLRISPKIDARRLEVIRLGVDCNALRATAARAVQHRAINSPGPLRIVCTGRMVAAKGHRILLEALSLLTISGVDFRCVLVGDGPERCVLEGLCNSFGIAERVEFRGALAHDSTLNEVAKADVFVLASFAEGLPVALMEAMGLGVPCVSTTIAAIPELIGDGKNGILVAPANPQALCNALQTLLNDAELRRRLGREARATVEDRYNLAKNIDLLGEMWSRRLSGDHPKTA